MIQYKVYAIFEGNKSNIKYIGYTSKPLTTRLGQHIERCAVLKSKKDRWLNSKLCDGTPIGIIELASFDLMQEALLEEIRQILEYSKTHELVNSSSGGEAGRNNTGVKKAKVYSLKPSTGIPTGEIYTVRMDYIDSIRSIMPIKYKYTTEAIASTIGWAADIVESYWEYTGLSKEIRNRFAVTEAMEYLSSTNGHMCANSITKLTGLSLNEVKVELNSLCTPDEG